MLQQKLHLQDEQINKESNKEKLGHREIKDGVVHYKNISSNYLKKSIQFGIIHFISEINGYTNKYNMSRDVLIQDFSVVERIIFPKTGSSTTPAHYYDDFKFKIYAPYGFKYLRNRLIGVNEMDFMTTIGINDLIDVTNPGASGAVFYKTSDDKFLLKTVQSEEASFLKELLPGYALNLLQNKYTLLPRIYGLFCYQNLELGSFLKDKTNIRLVVMNNILPSDLTFHEKYDLKGSSYKRKASKNERLKLSSTLKDLDFLEEHPNGIRILDEKNYDYLIKI